LEDGEGGVNTVKTLRFEKGATPPPAPMVAPPLAVRDSSCNERETHRKINPLFAQTYTINILANPALF